MSNGKPTTMAMIGEASPKVVSPPLREGEYKGPGEAGASGAGMGRRLGELPIAREQSLKVSQDEAVATTGPNGRRVTSRAP